MLFFDSVNYKQPLFSISKKLFGFLPVLRKDVYADCVKYRFLGLRVRKIRTPYLPPSITFKENCWYKLLLGGQFVKEPQKAPCNTVPPQPVTGMVRRINVDRALEQMPNINKIALVFFMGIGDYFYATPFIKKLKEKYPHLPFVAYVSQVYDNNNSPLVADCLRFNPNIDEIYMFDGVRNKKVWQNYDYSAVMSREPETTLVLPIIYDHIPQETLSRDDALCDTFGLPRSTLVPLPIIYDIPTASHVAETLEKVIDTINRHKLHGVVWLQLKSRSTDYEFEHAVALAKNLINAGYFVVCVDPLDPVDERCIALNLEQFCITDSIRLLQLLNEQTKTYCLTMVSCFWAISAGLNIPNLGIQHRFDHNLKTVYYPNLFIVTHAPYSCVPRTQQFLAKAESIENANRGIYQYKPDYLFECFQKMTEVIENRVKLVANIGMEN